jgi:pimeloyl-ACP methyl ester carboxylesterase
MNARSAAAVAAGVGGAAAAVGGLALVTNRSIARFESLDLERYPLPGNRFWVHGVAVHYVERGAGFPVVLVPGWAASTFSYRLLIEPLAERFRVVALDLPGFGFSERSPAHSYSVTSMATTLREFLRRLGIQRAVLIGHSLGGVVVQRLAVESPELVERLVLIGAASAAEPRREPRLVPSRTLAFFAQGLFAARPSLMGWGLRRIVADPAFATPAEAEGYLTPLRVPGTAAVLRRMIGDFGRDQAVDLSRISAPTLIIQGEADHLVPMRTATALNRQISGSRLEIVRDAGHLVPEEQPQEAARLISDFLAELPAAAQAAEDQPPTRRGSRGMRPSQQP